MAADIQFRLHDAQLQIHDCDRRFRVVVAGRRFGKSFLACIELLLEGLKDENEEGYDLSNEEVYYVAPTFEQAKRIMWPLLKQLGKLAVEGGVIEKVYEKECYVRLINGRRISIKGADDPDSLRGVGISFIVMDEYAFMKPDVWKIIVRPALSRAKGKALFIGTPDGKNHFYDLYTAALSDTTGDWAAFSFKSFDNPTLDPNEIRAAQNNMSIAQYRQEYEASFASGGSGHLREEWWKYTDEPKEGDWYVSIDLAGFVNTGTVGKKKLEVRDDHAITIAKCNTDGWWIKEIITGQWDVRETALRIVKVYSDIRPVKLGIEKGIAKNAVMPYLEDEMKRFNRYFPVWDLSHGGNAKADRIRWALQGRLEKGRLALNKEGLGYGSWQVKLVDQANDFPSTLSKDDMLDSLAYIDQLADVVYYEGSGIDDEWQPLDLTAGF